MTQGAVRMSKKLLICGLVAELMTGAGVCQQNAGGATLHGRVVDRNGVAVAGAHVVVAEGAAETVGISNGRGEFSIPDPGGPGEAVVRASTAGEAAMTAVPLRVARKDFGTELTVVVAPTAIAQQVTV